MAVPGNKEYVFIFRKEDGEVYSEVFRTMKHFCRWFNESEHDRVIRIEEVDGSSYYDKYFKNWVDISKLKEENAQLKKENEKLQKIIDEYRKEEL